MKERFVKLFVDGADLPGESLPGQSLLELYGDNRVLIENHQGILEYGTQKIQVKVKYGCICICGQGLQLCRMQGQQLVIVGRVESIGINRGR